MAVAESKSLASLGISPDLCGDFLTRSNYFCLLVEIEKA
jgi:hypothetical protein